VQDGLDGRALPPAGTPDLKAHVALDGNGGGQDHPEHPPPGQVRKPLPCFALVHLPYIALRARTMQVPPA